MDTLEFNKFEWITVIAMCFSNCMMHDYYKNNLSKINDTLQYLCL